MNAHHTSKPDASEIVHHAHGAVSITGPDAINLYRAATLKSGLNMYAKSGIKLTRTASPTQMLAMATEYTGKKYKRGEYAQAAADLQVWCDTMKAALPIRHENK